MYASTKPRRTSLRETPPTHLEGNECWIFVFVSKNEGGKNQPFAIGFDWNQWFVEGVSSGLDCGWEGESKLQNSRLCRFDLIFPLTFVLPLKSHFNNEHKIFPSGFWRGAFQKVEQTFSLHLENHWCDCNCTLFGRGFIFCLLRVWIYLERSNRVVAPLGLVTSVTLVHVFLFFLMHNRWG